MAFGLTIGTERASGLQNAIQDELTKRGYSPDAVMAEYITIMLINNKTPAQISSELEDLIGSDFDASFVDWLFAEAAKTAPESETPAAPEPSTSAPPVRDSPPHLQNEAPSRRPPNGPRAGAPLYQQALSQVIPSTSPTAQKRSASARSPSPSGPNKSRKMDVPTGPRAMFRDGHPGGSRSLLDRVGPARPQFGKDEIQARIDNITNSPDPNMQMMMGGGGFPMNGMPGMDMNAMAGMANPLMLQEMLMNQMALMSQMAGAMGLMNPSAAPFMNGAFPMQPGMGGDVGMFQGPPAGGMQPMGGADGGRGRGRGRGGAMGRGRGRGGTPGTPHAAPPVAEPTTVQPTPAAPSEATGAPAIVAPTPTPAVATSISAGAPAVTVPFGGPAASPSAQARNTFVPPERPQSPTLCKFGLKCTNPLCRWSHPSPVATPESGIVLSNEPCENGKNCKDKDCIKAHVSPAVLNPSAIENAKPSHFVPPAVTHPAAPTPCRFGAACTRPNCPFQHPARPHVQLCRFGAACTRANCPFQHPEGRVLPSTFHRGLSTTGPIVNVSTPETGSMGGPSYNKSMTFNKSTSAAALEKKVKEMEEKKSQAEAAVAEAQAAAAGKKDDSNANANGSHSVSIAA